MEPFGVRAITAATWIAGFVALRAARKGSLTRSGAITGFVVGFLLVGTGWRGVNLFSFYMLGTFATKYKIQIKSRFDATLTSHSSRGAVQVLCVSILAVGMSLWHAKTYGAEKPIDFSQYPGASRISCAILAHHATSLADTWASEFGILAPPNIPIRLVTAPWRLVPPGTNGGVTVNGFAWSLGGGMVMAMLTIIMDAISGLEPLHYAGPLLLFGALAGLIGSILDSVVGATLQETYYDADTKQIFHADSENKPPTARHITGYNILSNEQVNLVSTAISVVLCGYVIAPIMFR
jgi:uncharacterized protein (TIGR00297 family)